MDKLLELIISKGFDANYAGGGDEILFECPLCDDHKPRLYVSRRTMQWICHNCGEAGSVYSFLEKVLRYDPMMAGHLAQQLLGRKQGTVVAREEPKFEEAEIALPEGFVPFGAVSTLEDPFWRYLDGRGVDLNRVVSTPWGYVLSGFYANRVVIPIYRRGKRVGWIARDITGNAAQKVLTAPGMKTSQVLYNLDYVANIGRKRVGIVEGVFDALTLDSELVASMGAKLSPLQRRLLREAGVTCVTLLWDSDEAGVAGMLKTIPQLLGAGFEVKVATLPAGLDPNAAGPEAVAQALKEATPVTMVARHKLRRIIEAKLEGSN